jgi:hypothetical protein
MEQINPPPDMEEVFEISGTYMEIRRRCVQTTS